MMFSVFMFTFCIIGCAIYALHASLLPEQRMSYIDLKDEEKRRELKERFENYKNSWGGDFIFPESVIVKWLSYNIDTYPNSYPIVLGALEREDKDAIRSHCQSIMNITSNDTSFYMKEREKLKKWNMSDEDRDFANRTLSRFLD